MVAETIGNLVVECASFKWGPSDPGGGGEPSEPRCAAQAQLEPPDPSERLGRMGCHVSKNVGPRALTQVHPAQARAAQMCQLNDVRCSLGGPI